MLPDFCIFMASVKCVFKTRFWQQSKSGIKYAATWVLSKKILCQNTGSCSTITPKWFVTFKNLQIAVNPGRHNNQPSQAPELNLGIAACNYFRKFSGAKSSVIRWK